MPAAMIRTPLHRELAHRTADDAIMRLLHDRAS
jgi:hypothetical protein